MYRLALLTFASSTIAMSVAAQSIFTFSPTDTVIQDIPDNSYTQIYIYEENQTGDSLTLGVEIVSNQMPTSWDGMVCIYGTCLVTFPPVGFTGEMAPIHDTINGYVRVTANPMGSTESGSISVRVYDMDNPSDADTCTFILNPNSGTSIGEAETATVSAFPNPTTNVVSFTSDENFNHLRIMDSRGRVVLNELFRSTTTKSFLVGQLPSGMYMAELLSDKVLVSRKPLVVNE